jgi:hypothetical protein
MKQKRAGHWPARFADLLLLLKKDFIFSFSRLFSFHLFSWLSSLPRRHLLLGENGDPDTCARHAGGHLTNKTCKFRFPVALH